MRIIIDDRLPGLNDVIDACRRNKFAGAKLKEDMTLLCKVAFQNQCKKVYTNPIFLTFHWYEKSKARNKDNIASAIKFILDGMQEAGVIKNDGWAEIDNWKNKFYVDKDNPRVEVFIEEIIVRTE